VASGYLEKIKKFMKSKDKNSNSYHQPIERSLLLADVCEMYYLEGLSQAEIGRKIGLTSSMVSRLITEARERNMVDIRIHRPLESDFDLENALIEQFNLKTARVVTVRGYEYSLLKYLGQAGAQVFSQYIQPDQVIGVAWGTTLSAVVDAFDINEPVPTKLVELTGALGSRSSEYEGHGIITRLANKLGAEAHMLNAPFLCASEATAQALYEDQIISQPLKLANQAALALMGVGSLHPELATFLKFGYLSKTLLKSLHSAGAVGNVCGLYFDAEGNPACSEFCQKIITISRENLLSIPDRIGVAGGPEKVESIIGALRGSYVNILVTDNLTAQAILEKI
jgi:deoxyribonucleoside regulator